MDVKIVSVLDGAYALDGGSISLRVRDSGGSDHEILLVQHARPVAALSDRLPGRLYLDGALVELRSPREAAVITGLKVASRNTSSTREERPDAGSSEGRPIIGEDVREYFHAIELGHDVALAWLVRELVSYVESHDYVEFARRLGA